MIFESKHQVLKKIASQPVSHVNILKTICIKYQLLMMTDHCKQYKESFVTHRKNINNEIYLIFPVSKSASEVNSVTVNNFTYKKDIVIVTNIVDDVIEFGKIQKIHLVDTKIILDYTPYVAVGFDSHVFGYSVSKMHESKRIDYDELPTSTPCLLFTLMEDEYIVT